jgi:type II secretory pathway pseudopilin PulG
MKNCSRTEGFTLLEVIISFTILALMAGMVFSSLRLALNSYEKSQARLVEEAERRVLFDHIKRQIGSLFPLQPTVSRIGGAEQSQMQGQLAMEDRLAMSQVPLFFGESDFVTFITVAPLILHENPGLTVVRYGLSKTDSGRYYLGSMEARYTGLESFLVMAGLPEGEPLHLKDGVEVLEFQYYGFDPQAQVYDWFPAWIGEEMGSVPDAIRIVFDNEYVVVPVNAKFFGGNLRNRLRGLTRQRRQ